MNEDDKLKAFKSELKELMIKHEVDVIYFIDYDLPKMMVEIGEDCKTICTGKVIYTDDL